MGIALLITIAAFSCVSLGVMSFATLITRKYQLAIVLAILTALSGFFTTWLVSGL